MREIVREVVTKEIIALPQVAELVGTSPAKVYEYVVIDNLCEYVTIGKCHHAIDKHDLYIIRERVLLAKAYKSDRINYWIKKGNK